MTQQKKLPDTAQKIVDNKREKAQQKMPKGFRELTPQEKQFVDNWCVNMRPLDQAMTILNMQSILQKLARREMEREGVGLVKPDGSKIN